MNYIYELNKKYLLNNNNGEKSNNSNYIVIEGKKNILISAPHAVKQKNKLADAYTGGIVEAIAYYTDVFAIIRCCNCFDNPNEDNYGLGLEYKMKILDLIKQNNIKYLFDIHGCSNSHKFDIDIGTNNGRNCSESTVETILNEFGEFNLEVDKTFKASKCSNISKYIHELSLIDCIQFEISRNIRANEELLDLFFVCFTKFIKKLSG